MTARSSKTVDLGAVRRDRPPLVSVVIPSFRGGKFLREAVASVQAQTFTDWEIVVVLDGCDEDLSDIERDSRIRTIRQLRRGVSIARNVGITQSRANLVAFLDDDDLMLPERLEAQLQVMEDPSVGFCLTAFRVIDESGRPKFSDEEMTVRHINALNGHEDDRLGAPGSAEYRDLLRCETVVCLSSAIARKSVLQELGGFNPLLTMGEDLEFVYRVASAVPVVFLNVILSEYRRHANNTWSSSSTSHAQRLILKQHLLEAESHGRTGDAKAARTGLANLISGRSVFALERAQEAKLRGDYAGSVVPLVQAIAASPRGTTRALRRAFQRDILHDARAVDFVVDRIRQGWSCDKRRGVTNPDDSDANEAATAPARNVTGNDNSR